MAEATRFPHPGAMPAAAQRRRLAAALAAGLATAMAGCALMPGQEPPRVNVVGLERLEAEGFELRFVLKLRIQNLNARALPYDGLWIELDVNGRQLASGVSDAKGEVPRYGEAVISLPVSVHAVAAVRQLLGLSDGTPRGELPYAVRGRLGGAMMGGVRFNSEGVLRLPQ
jgi:LEA14-like dessication related protein